MRSGSVTPPVRRVLPRPPRLPAHCGVTGANKLSSRDGRQRSCSAQQAAGEQRPSSGESIYPQSRERLRTEPPAPTRGVRVSQGKSARGRCGGWTLQLTIACSILLSMATTLAPEALEESKEGRR